MSKPDRRKPIFVWVTACIIAGAFLAAFLFVIEERGYFNQWDELAVAPPRANELFSDKTGTIYVRTSSNEIYHLEWCEGDVCWINDDTSQDAVKVRPVEVTKPCDFSSSEFSPLTNVPESTIDCIQTFERQPDGFVRGAYVLDKDGTVWHWYTSASADPSVLIMLVCITVFGAIVGLLIGIGTSRLRILKRAAKKE